MGLAGRRRPPLPAPTESSIGAFDDDTDDTPPIAPSDLETNLTTRTDKTHYSIPEDGSPLVINTDKLRAQPKSLRLKDRAKANSSKSQTSLLIEYSPADEEDSEGNRRPSVRVRITPSSKNKRVGEQETRAAEGGFNRNASYGRSTGLGRGGGERAVSLQESNVSSFADGSDLVAGEASHFDLAGGRSRGLNRGFDVREDDEDNMEESRLAPINMSEISSMPADSLLATDLGADSPTKPLNRRRSRSLEREFESEPIEKLKPSHQRSRSLSRERAVARRAVEKFEQEARERKSKEKDREGKPRRSKSRSASNEYLASTSGKSRRKSSRSYDKEDDASNPSLLGSNVSGYSAQSGHSASSLSKNPKLLQTVEDAIRRLILPEINALKNEQKSQRRSDRYDDEVSSNASSVRSEERSSSRRVSGGKSGPKLKLNGETIKSTRGSRRSGGGQDSSDSLKRDFERGASEETVVRDEKSRRRSKDKARDAAVVATAAGLTAAALKARDSASSIERRERRKKRSKSHSRSGSRPESRADSVGDIFNKHDVPPMPLTGGLTDSDLTRESILSERTSTPTHERNREVRDFVKDSPGDPIHAGSMTPTRDMSPALDPEMDYAGHEYGDSIHLKREPFDPELNEEYLDEEDEDEIYAAHTMQTGYAQERPYMPMMGMYSGANYSSPTYGYQRRGLSPIQSVASFEERGEPPPDHMQHQKSLNSVSSLDRELRPENSIDSVSSGTAANIKRRSQRPKSVNMESPREALHGHESPAGFGAGMLGQDIRRLGANPELIETPHRAESAVASLMDPSTVGERSNLSYGSNDQGSTGKRYSAETDPRRASIISQERNLHTPERSSPLKHEVRHDDVDRGYSYKDRAAAISPSRAQRGHSAASSPFDANPMMQTSALPTAGSPMPEAGMYDDDLETNPSEIRDDPWEQKQTHHSNSAHDSLRAAANNMLLAAGALGAGAAIAQHHKGAHSEDYDKMDLDSPRHSESPGVRELQESPLHHQQTQPSPWVATGKDSGYVSGLPPQGAPPSDGSITPEPGKSKDILGTMNLGGDVAPDPFMTPTRERPMTADSDAMPSPLYDAATGRGMDRIKNQDIVALMDHLTVRDAQRNARDTEILVTLVRSAAEMRNSFEDMKRIMATQEERVLDSNNKQHMETRRAINGPRAMPPSKSMSSRAASAAEMNPDDIPAKKRNIFRKALRGLGGGSKQDLGNIETMLMQLLDEVAEIKAAQQIPGAVGGADAGGFIPPRTSSGLTSYEQLRDAPQGMQETYQPAPQASANQNDSGYSSANSSFRPMQQQGRRGSDALKFGANRVSTVHEDDEENEAPESPLNEREQNLLGDEEADAMLTPTREFRGVSVATGAPQTSHRQSVSADNTPTNRKHKSSGSSSFLPKISRWSKTTASSVPGLDQTPRQENQAHFSSQYNTPSKSRDQRPVSELSRSGSELGDYDVRDHYDPHGDDRLRSKTSLSNHSTSREVRPPSPLVPSTVSEKPTYSAHRDSKDLQHPQPRQGPTQRYQDHLESEAARGWYHSGSMESPTSDVMGQNPVLSRFGGRDRGDRYSGASAGAKELGTITETASADGGPPRPPKVKDDGPLVPPKVPMTQQQQQGGGNTRTVSFASDRMAQIIGTSAQGRKPTGPRPITRTGSTSPAPGQGWEDWKRHQYRGSPDHIPSDDESETF